MLILLKRRKILISDESAFNRILQEMTNIWVKKQHDYGSNNWHYLGLKMRFPDILRKCKRLETLVWEEKEPKVSETIRDTLLDLANYAVIAIMTYDREIELGIRNK